MTFTRALLLFLTIFAVASCKIRIEVPEGGSVVSDSGAFDCDAGKACTVDVVDAFFSETFRAKPANGYKFKNWKKRDSGLCGGKNPKPCSLSTTAFGPFPALMDVLISDKVFYLQPVFVKKDTDGDGLPDDVDEDIDGDFILNSQDAFELDPTESKDDDGDGIGNYADRDSTIYFIVTAEVNDSLSMEIWRFMADVSVDTNITPVLVTAPATVAEIRGLLKEAHKNDHLQGVFLIGNIPYFTLKNTAFPVVRVSDHPLRALSCPYQPDPKNASILWHTPSVSSLGACLPDIWASRIDPAGSGASAIEQVRGYLDKNNRTRTQHNNWQQRMSYIDATPRETRRDFSEDALDGFQDHPLYPASSVDVQQPLTSSSQLSTWVNALEASNEIVNLNIHGGPTGIQFQGEDVVDNFNFDATDLVSVESHAKVIEMTSCSVGDFSTDDYFAGNLLFSGDSLLITAFTAVTASADNSFELNIDQRFRAYGLGVSYADYYRFAYNGSPTHFYGDPTISLRKQDLPANRPRLLINGEHFTQSFDKYIDFGNAINDNTKKLVLEISNTGNQDLVVGGNFWTSQFNNVNGDIIAGTSGFVFILEGPARDGFSHELTVAPGETENVTFTFQPDANNNKTLESGAEYTGVFEMRSNDPISPGILLHVSGKHLKQ